MSFYFDSLQAFWWMDGHGPYVWVCYAATFAVFVALAISPKIRKTRFVKQQRALAARQQADPEVKDASR